MGADVTKDDWFAYFKELIAQGLLAQTDGEYPTIALTEKSENVLRGKMPVELFKIAAKEAKRDSLVSEISHPYFQDLFDELKQTRTAFARKENVPPYVVFSDATLVEFATYLPQDEVEIQRISGVGDVKMDKYGAEFLEPIRKYCKANDLRSRINLKSQRRERKSRTKRDANGHDTYSISLEMFRSGKSPAEIADVRSLALSTIERHLARFIPTGEVRLEELVPAHKIEPIRKAIIELNAETSVGPVKELLGEDYTYGEIHAVHAEFLRND